jgi:hypothetical protein
MLCKGKLTFSLFLKDFLIEITLLNDDQDPKLVRLPSLCFIFVLYVHFRPGNANNTVTIELITNQLAQNPAQCNYRQICANGYSNYTDFRQLLAFFSIVTQSHASIT